MTDLRERRIATVARALARSHGLGDHMTNLVPWTRDATTAVDALFPPAAEPVAQADLTAIAHVPGCQFVGTSLCNCPRPTA
jgi:hypothetical protein